MDWKAVASEMRFALEGLSRIDHDIYTESFEVAYVNSMIRNAGIILTGLHNHAPDDIKIQAQVHEDGYHKAVIDYHRSFLSGLHIYFEEGILIWARRWGIIVTSSRASRLEKFLSSAQGKLSSKDVKTIKALVDTHPTSQDIAVAITNVIPNKDRATEWRKFLRGFSVIRNTMSHSDPRLTELDKAAISEAGLTAWMNEYQIIANFSEYPRLVERLVEFFREIEGIMIKKKPATSGKGVESCSC